jgi:hypothetical protein
VVPTLPAKNAGRMGHPPVWEMKMRIGGCRFAPVESRHFTHLMLAHVSKMLTYVSKQNQAGAPPISPEES